MPSDDPATLWTGRAMVAAYVAAIAALVGTRDPSRRERRFRVLWTSAWVIAVAHAVTAFHRVHHWSHSAAWEHTAAQTRRVVGWGWGGGIVINYAFLAWWGIDVVLRWRRRSPLPIAYEIVMQSTFGFLFFNATAVFGPAPWRWITAAVVIGLLLLIGRRRTADA